MARTMLKIINGLNTALFAFVIFGAGVAVGLLISDPVSDSVRQQISTQTYEEWLRTAVACPHDPTTLCPMPNPGGTP